MTLPHQAAANEITVVTENLPPFQYYNQDKKLTGFSVEIVNALLNKANAEVTIQVLPWAQAYEMALKQKNVMIFSINRSSERQQKFKWVGDFLKQNYYFLSLNSRKDIKINHIKDVKGYITGVVRDSFEHQVLKKYGFSSPQNLHVSTAQIPLLNRLFERKIDLIFGSKINLLGTMDYIKRNRDDIKLIYQINETPGNVSIAFSKKTDDKTVNHFRHAFAAIKSDGTLDKIIKKWLGTH